MKAITKVLAGGAAMAALAGAAPAAAQYYPGYGYGYPNGGTVLGQVLQSVVGGGYGYGGYGANSQAVVNQCANAVQARLSGGGYGGYGAYGYNGYASPDGYGGGRVLGISRVQQRSSGGLTVRGVATSGRTGGYTSGFTGQQPVDLVWACRTDYRGFITGIEIGRPQSNYGYNPAPYGNGYNYSPYSNNPYDYSQYGYRRY